MLTSKGILSSHVVIARAAKSSSRSLVIPCSIIQAELTACLGHADLFTVTSTGTPFIACG